MGSHGTQKEDTAPEQNSGAGHRQFYNLSNGVDLHDVGIGAVMPCTHASQGREQCMVQVISYYYRVIIRDSSLHNKNVDSWLSADNARLNGDSDCLPKPFSPWLCVF